MSNTTKVLNHTNFIHFGKISNQEKIEIIPFGF